METNRHERAPVRLQQHRLGHSGVLLDATTFGSQIPTEVLHPRLPADAIPVASGGRQAAWYVTGMYGQAVLRHYRRGGLIARVNRQMYLWQGAQRTRAFAELHLLAKLYAQGLAVPRPLAAAWHRRAGLVYTAVLLTQRIPDVQTLAQARDHADPHTIAHAIAALHDAGVWHADLNAHNILLDAAGKVWLIDFDRGRDYGAPLSQALRVANLQRLQRSLEKTGAVPTLWQAIARAYTALKPA